MSSKITIVKQGLHYEIREIQHTQATALEEACRRVIRTMLVQSGSNGSAGGGSVTIENDFSIQEIDDLEYPLV